jgi:V8-like Glu-specific endopeptidase
MRMANLTRTGQYRCTVCGTVSGATNLNTQSEIVKVKQAAKVAEKKEPMKTAKDNKGKSTGKPEKKASLKGNKR